MRKLLAALLIFLAVPSFAQTYGSTKATMTLRKMFVQNGWFGFPPSAADPFTCNAFTERSAYWNTTSHVAKWCDATAWRTVTTSAALAPLSCDGTNCTIDGGGLILSGNISAAAWTTNGIKLRGAPGTLTDTSSSGTVAAAYTNVLGGNTIAASSATTFTDYYSLFLRLPVAGSGATLTNRWSLGTEGGAKFGDSVTLASGQLLLPAGAVASPSLAAVGQTGTGLYWLASGDRVLLTSGAAAKLEVGSNVNLYTDLLPNSTGTRALGGTTVRWKAGAFGGNTVTSSTPAVDIAQTWNSAGMSFIGSSHVYTETADAAGSRYFQILGGASGTTDEFYVGKGGTVYAAGQVSAPGYVNTSKVGTLGINGDFYLAAYTGKDYIFQTIDGTELLRMRSNGLLTIGGTTSSFPAIKRSSAGLVARLADDSADTTWTMSSMVLTATSSPTSGAACTVGNWTWDASYGYICTASGAWKRFALTGGY